MAPETQTGERYATQVGELWSGLSRTLARLEALAAEPELLDDDERSTRCGAFSTACTSRASTRSGSPAGRGRAGAHRARGGARRRARRDRRGRRGARRRRALDGVDALLHEWRGALFRVRLARLRLRRAAAGAATLDRSPRAGAAAARARARWRAVLARGRRRRRASRVGATLELWPVWVAGDARASAARSSRYRP